MKKFFTFIALAAFYSLMASSTLDLSSQEGETRLINSKYSNAYWVLNSHYVSQKPQSCGTGSAVMVLNALNIYRPTVEEYFNYTLFTPAKFLQAIQNIITHEKIKAGFMNMDVLAESLRLFSLDATVIHVDTITADGFRKILKDNLNNPQVYLIANYYRPAIGHAGKGNFSPIGAYDEASDSVLLLDALRDQYGPFWVSVEDLLASMSEADVSGEARGIILVKRHYTEIFSKMGRKMMKNSQYRGAYFRLSRYFETQEHWTYCAVASSVAVMNAFNNQFVYSQENFFTDKVQEIVRPEVVKTDWRGITADELVQMLAVHGFPADFVSGDMFTADTFRETLKLILNDPEQYLIANYNRPQVGQVGGGHFSPVVAYDHETDSVLILDTSRYKYAPVWIDLTIFVQSMQTITSEGLFRGYVTVRAHQK